MYKIIGLRWWEGKGLHYRWSLGNKFEGFGCCFSEEGSPQDDEETRYCTVLKTFGTTTKMCYARSVTLSSIQVVELHI